MSLSNSNHGVIRLGDTTSHGAGRVFAITPPMLSVLLCCRIGLAVAILTMAVLHAGNTQAESRGMLAPFTTDGCSLFPNRAVLTSADWCGCCVTHDLAYWRGGTVDERLQADQQLRACVLRVSGSEALAELMFSGVRSGGSPYFFTTYRWGYGWSYGRGYAPLTPEERLAAALLEAQYFSEHPVDWCETSREQPGLPAKLQSLWHKAQ